MKLKLILAAWLSVFFLIPAQSLAASSNCANPSTPTEAIKCGTNDTAGVPGGGTPEKTLDNTIANVLNILSIVVGIAAVVMLILGGFRYVTSSGNPEAIKSAKNTIMYALIGLVIVALAQVIVNFVLEKTTQKAKTGLYSRSQNA